MTTLDRYIDDLWMNQIHSFDQMSDSQKSTLIGYILRDYYKNDTAEALADFDFKDLTNYLIACDLGNPDMFEYIDMIKAAREKALDSIKSHLSQSMRDTIDMLFAEKEEQMEDTEINEMPRSSQYKNDPEFHYGKIKTL